MCVDPPRGPPPAPARRPQGRVVAAMEQADGTMLPTVFLSHGGGPAFFMNATSGSFAHIGASSPIVAWYRRIFAPGGALSDLPRPSSMIVISAHWEEPMPTILDAGEEGAERSYDLFFDYYGFPRSTYALEWPAKGQPALARRVVELLHGIGLDCAVDAQRGLDHGVFIPLKLAVPDADIPLVQLSLVQGLEPSVHYAIGEALQPLRAQGVLIVGSGQATHNFRAADPCPPRPDYLDAETQAFVDWLRSVVTDGDLPPEERKRLLVEWEQRAPHARHAHPREEHLLPCLVVAGAAGSAKGVVMNEPDAFSGAFSLDCFRFGC